VAFIIMSEQSESVLSPSRLAEELSTHWGVSATCHLIELDHCSDSQSTAASVRIRELLGVLQIRQHRFYRPFMQPTTREALRSLIGQLRPGLLFVHKLAAMLPVLSLAGISPRPAIVFDLDDVEHRAGFRALRASPTYPSKIVDYMGLLAFIKAESAGTRLADFTLVCSAIDKRYLSRLMCYGQIEVLPNTVDIPQCIEPEESARPDSRALFIGDLRYEPNAVAARHLCDNIWPLVRDRYPQAELIIAGKLPPEHGFTLDLPGISFTGFVEDLDQLYQSCAIVCCPITFGGGTRVKLCEAAAFGKAMVSTHIGAEGIDFSDGVNILLRDGHKEFAEAVVSLFEKPQLAKDLGQAARRYAIEHLDARQGASRLAGQMAGLLEEAES
jgi:glycosyltransferase involved in cell wall biosynthesis